MLSSLDDPIFHLYAKNLRYWLIPSRDIDNQRILQRDWLRALTIITEEPDFPQSCGFCFIMILHGFCGKKQDPNAPFVKFKLTFPDYLSISRKPQIESMVNRQLIMVMTVRDLKYQCPIGMVILINLVNSLYSMNLAPSTSSGNTLH